MKIFSQLSLIFIFALLTACGGSSNDSTDGSSGNGNLGPSGVTIDLWDYIVPNQPIANINQYFYDYGDNKTWQGRLDNKVSTFEIIDNSTVINRLDGEQAHTFTKDQDSILIESEEHVVSGSFEKEIKKPRKIKTREEFNDLNDARGRVAVFGPFKNDTLKFPTSNGEIQASLKDYIIYVHRDHWDTVEMTFYEKERGWSIYFEIDWCPNKVELQNSIEFYLQECDADWTDLNIATPQ